MKIFIILKTWFFYTLKLTFLKYTWLIFLKPFFTKLQTS